ncbi:CPXCG motif-containing cysteine-rich protein [uncultured Thiohalocapsa sp.]|uniref:CPXCG motif-containing cysteine-rich protein n=1 Tax=uncultured Thiohalocapsa sp. TaxID=768990 RepID=UPI0025E70C7E|nr:CPXCG motif-containing cysteine-rich protein [uncultured Thiohalocapsa sp.]
MEALQVCVQQCPWCGELIELTVDCSYGDHVYVEDCSVCCAPIEVTIRFTGADPVSPRVDLRRENE